MEGANVTHTLTVSASSLYEAAALGIAEFKKSGFAFANIGPATRLTIAVEAAGQHARTLSGQAASLAEH